MLAEQKYRTKYVEIEGGEENREEKLDNPSEHKTQKRQRTELQGEFRKIKPPLFEGEQEEAAEA